MPRTVKMLPAILTTCFLAMGCDGSTSTTDAGSGPSDKARPDSAVGMAPEKDAGSTTHADGAVRRAISVGEGAVSGEWCGDVAVTGDVTIPEGESLVICAGSIVTVGNGFRIKVEGNLSIEGTETDSVLLTSNDTWFGLRVAGTLEGDHVILEKAMTGIQGLSESTIRFDDSTLREVSLAFSVLHGATFDRTTILGGQSVDVGGGTLRMTDSVIDLGHPTVSPDCTKFSGSNAVLSHVRFTGCHCPIHINSGEGSFMVTDSIFDDAAVAMMIGNAEGTFARNHFLGKLSLNDLGPINANVADNYYGGGAPTISPNKPDRFKGAGTYRTDPVAGVGPR